MKRLALLLCLLFATRVLAADGDLCVAAMAANAQPGGYSCQKLCDLKGTGAITCPAMLVADQKSKLNKIRVETNGGCTYTGVLVGELTTSTTSGIEPKTLGVLDSTIVAATGTTGVSEIIVPFEIGPFINVSAGTLAGCGTSTFAIWLLQKSL